MRFECITKGLWGRQTRHQRRQHLGFQKQKLFLTKSFLFARDTPKVMALHRPVKNNFITYRLLGNTVTSSPYQEADSHYLWTYDAVAVPSSFYVFVVITNGNKYKYIIINKLMCISHVVWLAHHQIMDWGACLYLTGSLKGPDLWEEITHQGQVLSNACSVSKQLLRTWKNFYLERQSCDQP